MANGGKRRQHRATKEDPHQNFRQGGVPTRRGRMRDWWHKANIEHHRKWVVGMAHLVAEDPRDRPSFGLGQQTHEIDRRALPHAPESAGYVDTSAWRPCSKVAPSCSVPGLSISAHWRHQRGVHRESGPSKQVKSIDHHLKASTVHFDCWRSRTKIFMDTRPPASRQT